MSAKNIVVIITGPSAVGKTAVAKGILKKIKSFKPSVTYTTRGKRKKYSEDKIMRYVTVAKFKKLIRDKKLLEWAEVYGNFYGSSLAALQRKIKKYNILLNLDVQGAKTVREKIGHTLSFFIKPENIKQLQQRLEARSMPLRDKKLRLRSVKNELSQAKIFDYQIVNYQGKLDKTIDQVVKIIKNRLKK